MLKSVVPAEEVFMAVTVSAKKTRDFDPKKFLATIGTGRQVMSFAKKQAIFTQGEPADAVFYIQGGKVQLNVVSKTGREATLGILGDRDVFGEGSLAGQALRMGSATAMTDCELLRIEKKAMMNALHREHAFPICSSRICWRGIFVTRKTW
jgi:CRP/FNR family cyclic AMP-dependent transcriptional regulator